MGKLTPKVDFFRVSDLRYFRLRAPKRSKGDLLGFYHFQARQKCILPQGC